MFSKILSLILSVSFFTVSASASTHDGLKSAFDELNYSLTVEWDQQDQTFLANQKEAFRNEISDMLSEGLTRAELVAFVKSELKDAHLAKDLDSMLEAVSLGKLSFDQINDRVLELMNNSYSSGSSWVSYKDAGIMTGFIIFSTIVFVAYERSGMSGI